MKDNKLKTRKEIKSIVENLKKLGKKVVTTNGCFDLVHAGHVIFLEEAKKQGDVLIVGLNSDRSIRKLKGKDRPIVAQSYRAKILCALSCVDFVTIFGEQTPIRLLSTIKPHIHVNGEEYGYNCIEALAVKKHGGHIYLVKRKKGLATTDIIKKIRGLK